jgi:hypothetical protein
MLTLSPALAPADPYLNTDAGTMSPFEHGEVFVLDDGGEVGELDWLEGSRRCVGPLRRCLPPRRPAARELPPFCSVAAGWAGFG